MVYMSSQRPQNSLKRQPHFPWSFPQLIPALSFPSTCYQLIIITVSYYPLLSPGNLKTPVLHAPGNFCVFLLFFIIFLKYFVALVARGILFLASRLLEEYYFWHQGSSHHIPEACCLLILTSVYMLESISDLDRDEFQDWIDNQAAQSLQEEYKEHRELQQVLQHQPRNGIVFTQCCKCVSQHSANICLLTYTKRLAHEGQEFTTVRVHGRESLGYLDWELVSMKFDIVEAYCVIILGLPRTQPRALQRPLSPSISLMERTLNRVMRSKGSLNSNTINLDSRHQKEKNIQDLTHKRYFFKSFLSFAVFFFFPFFFFFSFFFFFFYEKFLSPEKKEPCALLLKQDKENEKT
ncbi:hypothetical protein VP01_1540g1 [Puccinia sorghi]|uniref:Uncharacterized protein n=1 Tax=Puccinia sorghi TaxID=27349 RepID=A0A0L6VID6_9BASI|nr:hypothetical protein VP01_1540g1 [Puccinia sorghi]